MHGYLARARAAPQSSNRPISPDLENGFGEDSGKDG
jgi:hypothetical protein